ncbi:hypothetical protein PsorP6_001989 [Peronosclerospora sorghi]|uniref:Uncharacterized protein n=1 Tax=Peronosclerospora sorghi TaxID=230839 RepID=A0ACC0WV79_9STRA|nr:hypothetical protein PsorP6_001989 [Peronosclerospora sorghi]
MSSRFAHARKILRSSKYRYPRAPLTAAPSGRNTAVVRAYSPSPLIARFAAPMPFLSDALVNIVIQISNHVLT